MMRPAVDTDKHKHMCECTHAHTHTHTHTHTMKNTGAHAFPASFACCLCRLSPEVYEVSDVDRLRHVFRFDAARRRRRHVERALAQEGAALRRHVRQVVHHHEHLHHRLVRVE